MAKKKYKKKPESWYCIQYDGTNIEEMTGFCPLVTYDTNKQQLLFAQYSVVEPTYWILEDNAGVFSMMIAQQFDAFFSLAPAQDEPNVETQPA